ncbi:MAG: hypothetical protein RL839_13750 [Gammaproteobacteria bacterium]
MKRIMILSIFLTLGLAACEQGPAERLGEDLDNAADDIGNAAEDACEELSNRPC